MIDLTAEWLRSISNVRPHQIHWLKKHGCSGDFLIGGLMQFGVERISDIGGGLYEPNTTGDAAVILPAIQPPAFSEWEGDPLEPGDLVAFFPQRPEITLLRCGTSPILNAEAVTRAAWDLQPLTVFESPLEYLRADGAGIVVLDWQCYLPFHLGDVSRLVAQSLDLAERLDRALNRPPPRTNIHVRKAAVA